MPRIRLIIEDDNGTALEGSEQVYALLTSCENLDSIETSVESFKREALPKVEARLLSSAQDKQVQQEKKDSDGAATERRA